MIENAFFFSLFHPSAFLTSMYVSQCNVIIIGITVGRRKGEGRGIVCLVLCYVGKTINKT